MKCGRCRGCLFWNYEEWFCANCGWRENTPLPVPHVGLRHATQCVQCDQPRTKYSTLCRAHAIREGCSRKRNRG